jgi:hypothetical protein
MNFGNIPRNEMPYTLLKQSSILPYKIHDEHKIPLSKIQGHTQYKRYFSSYMRVLSNIITKLQVKLTDILTTLLLFALEITVWILLIV